MNGNAYLTGNKIRKYQLGLLVLLFLTFGLLAYVLIQGSSQKQDNLTDKKAQEVADKLNNYTTEKYTVPNSLTDLKVAEVPGTITYSKQSSTSYKFCATYKNASDSFSSTNIQNAALSKVEGYDPSAYSNPTSDGSYLTIGEHKKGENCQTITIYGGYNYNTDGTSGSSFDSICGDTNYSSSSCSGVTPGTSEQKLPIN